MAPIIEVKNIGKKYNITHMKGGYVALRDVVATTLKNPFGFIKNKAKSAIGLSKKEEFWALKDVSFSVERGEVVGIIGANGAGKSTLLKILSQITPPTEGEIILNGRVGSLLEVGTGFHPELTGRENIFLNGAILGMKKSEIAQKFDEIVTFAGIEKFLDTPVKFYSSGMYVRLAFSVAAHMEPDILIIDEVLAVGDAEFQKKCLGKMDEISKKEGRTVLFVSHNMDAIKDICNRTILINKGKKVFDGETKKTLEEYEKMGAKETVRVNKGEYGKNRRGSGTVSFTKIEMLDKTNKDRNVFTVGETVIFKLSYAVYEEMNDLQTNICLFSNKVKSLLLTDVRYEIKSGLIKKGEIGEVFIEIDLNNIRPGEYPLYFWIGDKKSNYESLPTNYDVVDNMTAPLIVKENNSINKKTTGIFSLPSRIR